MHFKKLRAMSACTSAISVTTRYRSEIIKRFGCLPENAGCFPSAVVIMTTAYGMHLAFSGRHPKRFIISGLYRSLPISHGNCRSPLYPCYVNVFTSSFPFPSSYHQIWIFSTDLSISYPRTQHHFRFDLSYYSGPRTADFSSCEQ